MTRRGLTPRKSELIGHIAAYRAAHKKSPSHIDLAALMGCSKQNVTRMVSELAEQGFITKASTAQRNLRVAP